MVESERVHLYRCDIPTDTVDDIIVKFVAREIPSAINPAIRNIFALLRASAAAWNVRTCILGLRINGIAIKLRKKIGLLRSAHALRLLANKV